MNMRVIPVKENFDLKIKGILSILNHGILELSRKSTRVHAFKNKRNGIFITQIPVKSIINTKEKQAVPCGMHKLMETLVSAVSTSLVMPHVLHVILLYISMVSKEQFYVAARHTVSQKLSRSERVCIKTGTQHFRNSMLTPCARAYVTRNNFLSTNFFD